MSIYYLGAFPIEGGGVTNKNRDLFNALTNRGLTIRKVDLNLIKRKKSIKEAFKLICALMPGNQYIIGVSGARGTSIKLVKFLDKVSHNNLKRSLYFMMGGTEAHKIAINEELINLFSNFKKVYVEMASMKSALDNAGMENVDIFPNCRPKPNQQGVKSVKADESFKCVYFSYIEPMKGVDAILAVAQMMPNVEFDFYGDIAPEYKNVFLNSVNNTNNCQYYGYFNGDSTEIYKLLGKYDVLLFPTKWETEGVPGVLVEAKIAGLPVIASRSSYNSEIVEEDIDGILLTENTPEELSKKITELLENPETLLRMKNACRYTATKYYIEQYSESISRNLLGG